MASACRTILCVESDQSVLRSRCAALQSSGYEATAASPQLAEILLTYRKFDLLVVSRASAYEIDRLVNVSDGAQILVLNELATPVDLLNLVAARLANP
jgi:CheY-like chemotaxis protein